MESLLHSRNKEIEKLYHEIMSCTSVNMSYADKDTIFELIMEHPAPRFYITPKMAERYVLGFKKQSEKVINSRKIDMIKDLVSVYNKVITRRKRSSRLMIWQYVVSSPAKSFYVSKKRLREILFNYKGRNGSKCEINQRGSGKGS